MSTSGVTTWPLTAAEIIKAAMQELGLIGSGEEPETAEVTDGLLLLNALLKTWGVRGNMFREASGTVTVPAGSASGTLDYNIRDISSARVIVSATNHRPLQAWGRTNYLQLPNKTASGSPTIFYLERNLNEVRMYLWPVPTTDTTLAIDYSRVPETVTASTQTVDIPEDWQEALIANLAVRLAPMFGAARTDPTTLATVTQRAAMLEAQMLDADRPDTYVFEPGLTY